MSTELVLSEAKIMKNIIDPMVAVGEDIMIQISEEGFRAQTRALNKVWAADAFLDKSIFDKISVENEVIYSLKLKDLSDFIKTVSGDDELVIREDTENQSLVLELNSTSMVKKIVLRLQSLPDDFRFLEISNRPFPSNATMMVELFAQAVRTAELGGEEVELHHQPTGLRFTAKSTTRSSEAQISYESEKVENVQFNDGLDSLASIFYLEYLKHVSRVGKSDDRLLLSMLQDGPLRIVYTFREDVDEESQGYLAFAIAPRIKGDQGGESSS